MLENYFNNVLAFCFMGFNTNVLEREQTRP